MSPCIFCKIVSGEIPCHRVFEDEKFLVFLDISPRNKGHALVIPKDHHRWVWDYPRPGSYFELATRVAKAQKTAFGTDYVVSCIFGEEVPHAHIHLIPRYPHDGHGGSINFANIKKLSEIEMKDALQKLRAALAVL